MGTVSVIITTYRRMRTINQVVKAWLAQPVIEVWLVDGSGGQAINKLESSVTMDSRFHYWPMWRDKGTRTDYALAHLTDGDMVLLADDDVLPKWGLTEDLISTLNNTESDIVGIIGRTFHGPRYYKDTKYYRSDKLEKAKPVDFVGVLYLAKRNMFGFDTRGMHRNCDDLWWQMREYPEAHKWVAATKNYEDLPEAKDGMFHDPEARRVREKFYEQYWKRNYS